jgi:hypothetical protein
LNQWGDQVAPPPSEIVLLYHAVTVTPRSRTYGDQRKTEISQDLWATAIETTTRLNRENTSPQDPVDDLHARFASASTSETARSRS